MTSSISNFITLTCVNWGLENGGQTPADTEVRGCMHLGMNAEVLSCAEGQSEDLRHLAHFLMVVLHQSLQFLHHLQVENHSSQGTVSVWEEPNQVPRQLGSSVSDLVDFLDCSGAVD